MTQFRRLALAALAVPLAMALSSCGSKDKSDTAVAVASTPVPKVAPPVGKTWMEVASRTKQGGWLVGNPNAPIKLVEYGSVTCPACAAFSHEAYKSLSQNYVDSGRVSWEFRPVLIHGVMDLIITRLVECVPTNVAVPMAHQLWENVRTVTAPFEQNQAEMQKLSQLPEKQRFTAMAKAANLYDFFAARGLGKQAAEQCLTNIPAIEHLAKQSQAQANADSITHTPTLFVNGKLVNSTSWSGVEPVLQQAGAR